MLWVEDTHLIGVEAKEADRTDVANLAGEAFSFSTEFLIFFSNQAYPAAGCDQTMYWAAINHVTNWSIIYAGIYYNLTTFVGEPVGIQSLTDDANLFEEFTFNQNEIFIDCLATIER